MITLVTQVSVFLTDKPGELAQAIAALAEAHINIRALSTAQQASDHGVVRFVVDDAEAAQRVLGPVSLAVRATDVLFVQMPDRPRALLGVMQRLAAAGVNIEYVYGSVAQPGMSAPAVFKVDDIETAQKVLADV